MSLLFAAACGPTAEPDPLSEEVVNDLSEEIGTGTGDRYSGDYDLTLTSTSCDCPTIDAGEEFGEVDVCEFVAADVEGGIWPVLQTGGFLVINSDYTGAIELDGSFSVGSVSNFSDAVLEGKAIGRIDGAFGSSAEAGFEGELQQRAIVDSAVLSEPVDCRATFDVVATYLP